MRILRDTREKKGYWAFSGKRCKSTALKTGDYTIEGYEDTLCIERKKSVAELAQNFTNKSKAFWREVERMEQIEHSYLILEFSEDELLNFPWKSDLPSYIKRKIRVRGGFLATKIQEIEARGIEVIFAEDRAGAIAVAERIFNEILAEE